MPLFRTADGNACVTGAPQAGQTYAVIRNRILANSRSCRVVRWFSDAGGTRPATTSEVISFLAFAKHYTENSAF